MEIDKLYNRRTSRQYVGVVGGDIDGGGGE